MDAYDDVIARLLKSEEPSIRYRIRTGEMDRIHDDRCREALDLLESKRRPDGGFPAERRYYSVIDGSDRCNRSGQTVISWGPVSTRARGPSNDFATAEALAVLRAAGRT